MNIHILLTKDNSYMLNYVPIINANESLLRIFYSLLSGR